MAERLNVRPVTTPAKEADEMNRLSLAEVEMTDPWAEALIRCFDLFMERRTRGSRLLYDAVNDAFVTLAQKRYWS